MLGCSQFFSQNSFLTWNNEDLSDILQMTAVKYDVLGQFSEDCEVSMRDVIKNAPVRGRGERGKRLEYQPARLQG